MIVVGVSGASGPILGIRLIEELLNNNEEVFAVASETAKQIIKHELSLNNDSPFTLSSLIAFRGKSKNIQLLQEFDNADFFSPVASGSTNFEAMVVIPCSMKTLSAMANGYADSLITRACDVCLKERRKLIVVPRETPLNLVHLENMLRMTRAGATILPPVMGFYTLPKTVDDMINFVLGKILNSLGKKNPLFGSWGDIPSSENGQQI
ncbi:MAG: UbiX family flavin prenyltransferase [Desulfomonilaceae bacterium]